MLRLRAMSYFLYLLGALLLWRLFSLALGRPANDSWSSLQTQKKHAQLQLDTFLNAQPNPPLPGVHCLPLLEHAPLAYWQTKQEVELLAVAETQMAQDSNNPVTRQLLCHALLLCSDLEAADAQWLDASTLDPNGAWLSYLKVRIELEQHITVSQKGEGDTALLSSVDRFALEMQSRIFERGDVSALWLPGQGSELSKEEAADFVLSHFELHYALLGQLLDTLKPKVYSDGLYLLSRLALKCGFMKQGSTLLVSLEQDMKNSHEHTAYLHDLSQLRGKERDTPKSVHLKVLN